MRRSLNTLHGDIITAVTKEAGLHSHACCTTMSRNRALPEGILDCKRCASCPSGDTLCYRANRLVIIAGDSHHNVINLNCYHM